MTAQPGGRDWARECVVLAGVLTGNACRRCGTTALIKERVDKARKRSSHTRQRKVAWYSRGLFHGKAAAETSNEAWRPLNRQVLLFPSGGHKTSIQQDQEVRSPPDASDKLKKDEGHLGRTSADEGRGKKKRETEESQPRRGGGQ